jgi:PAS domain S-box-containing protein
MSVLRATETSASITRRLLQTRWLVPLAVATLSVVMTIAVWLRLQHAEVDERQASLTREVALISVEIRDRLRSHAQVLRGIRAFFATTQNLSPERWRTYSEQLNIERLIPGIEAYGFAQRIGSDPESLTDHAGSRTESAGTSPVQPAQNRQSFVIRHNAPTSAQSGHGIGFDLYGEAKRRLAIERARDTDDVALSGRIKTGLETTMSTNAAPSPEAPSVWMVMPVYRTDSAPRTVSARRKEITGVAYAAYRISDLMDSLNYVRNGNLGLRIFDDESFNSERDAQGLTLLFDSFRETSGNSAAVEEREVEFGQRKWLLQFQPKDKLPLLRESTLLLGGGLIISFLLGLLTWNLSTRRVQAETYAQKMNGELQLSEERFQLAAQGTNDGLWDRDLRSDKMYASKRLEELLGYLPGRMPRDINFILSRVHPEDRPAVRAAAINHFKEHAPYDVEYRMLKANGDYCWFSSRGQAVWDESGRAIRMAGAIADISQRKEAELAILQTNQKLQSVLDAATEVSIIATDTEGTIRIFNRGAEKMLGYFASELIDCQTPAAIHLESEVIQRGQELSAELGRPIINFDVFVALPQMQGAERREWTYVRKDGSWLTVSLVVTAVRNEDDRVTGYLGIAVDITDRKLAVAELLRHRDHLRELVAEQVADLLRAKDVAERANNAKSEFLANMSHELRTPMHAVLSFAALGEEKAEAASAVKLQHYFHRINQSGGRLLMLLNNLLDLAKLEAGKMHVELMQHDVLPLIQEAAAELETMLNQRDLKLLIQPAPCSTKAFCDPTRFGQVISNLLSNAIKFSPDQGEITVSFERSSMPAGRRTDDGSVMPTLRITVADQGLGIPADEMDTIFDKFVQSSKTRSGAGGTGLGLSICREIMHAHRGTIEACNNESQGASFIVKLPLSPSPFINPALREA